ncbi:potassium transporter TrkG [uncultured Litoreibacter sp.]|uniref:TrkH family potassium uptake protein n=1 Tax=uncultured Litoreibacter sp. TaxID=1392394 RepID=UPI00261FF905|nr:potassium transporter TrkG [uncultured Litoreibacter sp.]
MGVLFKLPLFVVLMAIGSAAMLVPAVHALALDLHRTAQPFFYGAVLFGVLTALIGLATYDRPATNVARNQLMTLIAAFAVLPLMLAVPMREAIGTVSFFDAYFEMVSSITTTGASLFDPPSQVVSPIHLWRALVGWMGGFLILLAAVAVLAPLALGGFEVVRPTNKSSNADSVIRRADPSERILRYTLQLFPIYAGATLVLWVALVVAGTGPFLGLCLAMSTLATSGITPSGGLNPWQVGIYAELLIFIFLFMAVSRQVFTNEAQQGFWRRLGHDREVRMTLLIVSLLPMVLFLRHWAGAFDAEEQGDVMAAIRAFWGALFTVLSFLTTTGFASHDWEAARAWSGLPTPGLVLAGLAITGGGVATTAGGVKLLRVYALYKHGTREMGRLVHPNSIGRAGKLGREVRREGAFIAWIFFMLFALTIAVVILGLTATGLDFEAATAFAISAITTTGPLADVALEEVAYTDLGATAKSILMAAMVLGRLETLAIVAMFNPDFWRS